MPSLEQLVIYHYTPCHDQCENNIPFEESIQILIYGIMEYGTFFNCQTVYSFYIFQFLHGRYPRGDEIEQNHSQWLTEMMNLHNDDFWEHRQLEIDWTKCTKTTIQDIPSYACAICQDEFEIDSAVIKLPCSHVFHAASESCEGIEKWLSRMNVCPLCKTEI